MLPTGDRGKLQEKLVQTDLVAELSKAPDFLSSNHRTYVWDRAPPMTAEFLNKVFLQKLTARENVDNFHKQFKPVCKMTRFLSLYIMTYKFSYLSGKVNFLNILFNTAHHWGLE